MKTVELNQLVQSGQPVMVGNVMLSQAERIKWRDKTSGAAKEAPILRHTVMTNKGAVSVSERVDDSFDEKTYVSPWKRDQRVVVALTEYMSIKGNITARGVIHPLDDVPSGVKS